MFFHHGLETARALESWKALCSCVQPYLPVAQMWQALVHDWAQSFEEWSLLPSSVIHLPNIRLADVNSGNCIKGRILQGEDIPGGQRLRFCAPNTGSLGSIPGRGTRYHMQLKILSCNEERSCPVPPLRPGTATEMNIKTPCSPSPEQTLLTCWGTSFWRLFLCCIHLYSNMLYL